MLLLAASPSQQPGLHSETVPPFKEKKSHAGMSRESITKLGKIGSSQNVWLWL